jgi:hypothetical protein
MMVWRDASSGSAGLGGDIGWALASVNYDYLGETDLDLCVDRVIDE